MKKAFILLFVSIFTITLASKADDASGKASSSISKISDFTLKQFSSTFYRASDVSWSINKSHQKASFVLNGKTASAIYDTNNEFLVATQNINVNDIPEKAKESIKTTYKNYRIAKAVKVLSRPADYQYTDDTDHLWVSLFVDNKEIILLISPDSYISTVSVKTLGS